MSNYTKDFFISYTSKDLEWARWIAWELREANYTYVLQDEHFAPAQDFIHRMRTALNDCRHVIAVLSRTYFDSEFAQAELNAALRADPLGIRARLIPVRVRECELDEMLKARIYINLVGKKDTSVLRHDLISGIKAAIATTIPDSTDVFTEVPKPPVDEVERTESAQPEPPARSRSNTTGSGTSHGKRKGATKVLFLGLDIGRGLDLRRQYHGIRDILAAASRTGPFRVKGRFDTTAETLPDVLATEAPDIVHFSGNQNGGRVLIKSEAGGITTIPAMAIRGMLQTLDGAVRLAIIDTCDSLPSAREATTAIDAARGVSGQPYDVDAIRFYETFYRALARGQSLAAAHEQAAAAHKLRGIAPTETPRLCVRKGVDAKGIHFRRTDPRTTT